jgi:hypothetical protein
VFDLRDATFLGEISTPSTLVPRFDHYAVTAAFDSLENTALVPGGNSVAGPAAVPAASPWGFGALALLLLAVGRGALNRLRGRSAGRSCAAADARHSQVGGP